MRLAVTVEDRAFRRSLLHRLREGFPAFRKAAEKLCALLHADRKAPPKNQCLRGQASLGCAFLGRMPASAHAFDTETFEMFLVGREVGDAESNSPMPMSLRRGFGVRFSSMSRMLSRMTRETVQPLARTSRSRAA